MARKQEHRPDNALVRVLVEETDVDQQRALLNWAEQLLQIQRSQASSLTKAREALAVTRRARIAWPLIKRANQHMHATLWKNRGWKSRLGVGGAVAAAVAFGSQGAGIAALGTAIGVPLWLVLGAGAALLGTLIDELKSQLGDREPIAHYSVIESKRESAKLDTGSDKPPLFPGN